MIFDEQIARKPDLYPWTMEFIKAMWESHWTPAEFTFESDLHDFKTRLTPQEQQIIVRTLSAIGQIEIAVKTFWARLGDNLKHPSLVDMGLVMANVEVIHNIAYEKLLVVLGLSDAFEDNLKLDVINGRVKYLRKYTDKVYKDNRKQYVYALILFTLFVENISLFSQFYVVLWFGRYKNVLKDTNNQVTYTKNEELIHARVGVHLINTIRKEYPELFDSELEARVIHEASEAFKSESNIIDWILDGYKGERISPDTLKSYVKTRIAESLDAIGFKVPDDYKITPEAQRDIEWMQEEVLGSNMKDFFDGISVDYAKSNKSFNEGDLFGDTNIQLVERES